MATNNPVNVGLSGATGTGNFVGSTAPTIVTPKIAAINDPPNNTKVVDIVGVASGVNYVQLGNAVTTGPAFVAAQGADSNIALNIKGKGTSGINLFGITSGVAQGAGYVGEVKTLNVLSGAVSIATATTANVGSLVLTSGNWIVFGNVDLEFSVASSFASGWLSLTSATLPDASLISCTRASTTSFAVPVPLLIANVSGSTTVYLSQRCVFGGTGTVGGNIIAIRYM